MNPLTNPPSTTADAAMAEAADPLDALLRQIVGGFFVLDGRPGVGLQVVEPAELLFDLPGRRRARQALLQVRLINAGQLPPEGQAWREFLDLGEPPRVPGSVS